VEFVACAVRSNRSVVDVEGWAGVGLIGDADIVGLSNSFRIWEYERLPYSAD